MGVRVPKITLNADFGDESAFGELSLLSVGYGLHQAWVYATMFGAASVFWPMPCFQGLYGSSVTVPYLISTIVYVFAMLLIAATDQRFLKLYTSRKLLCIGAALSCVGSLLLLTVPFFGTPLAETASGIMTGIGSAILIVYWGTAFARTDSASIVLNTAIAISIAIGLFATVLHYAPFPVSAIAIACVPLLELAILLKKTPQPFHERNEVPVFKPLPINRGRFVVRFGAPVLVLGIALGTLRSNSLQNLMMKTSVGAQPMLLLAAGCATVLVLVTIMALGGGGGWSRFFQPLVPFIAVTVFIMPLASTENTALTSVIMLVGFLCFESLMWIFFADLSQRFRLSPIFVFGLGRAILAIAIMFGALVPVALASYAHLLPFGEQALVVLLLLVIVFAYALLPREREIESIIMPCPLVKAVSASFERKEESQRAAGLRNCGASKGMEALEQGWPRAPSSANGRRTTWQQKAKHPCWRTLPRQPSPRPLSVGRPKRLLAKFPLQPATPPRTAPRVKAAKARWAQGQLEAQANPKARRLHNLPEPRTGTTTRRTRPQRHPPCPPRANGKQPTPHPRRLPKRASRNPANRRAAAAVSAANARPLQTRSSCRVARPRSCSSWPKAITPPTSRRSSISRRARPRRTSATSTASATSTTSRTSCAWSRTRSRRNSGARPAWPSAEHDPPTTLAQRGAGLARCGNGSGERERRGFGNKRMRGRRSRALDPLPRFPDASPGDSPLTIK